MLKFWWIELVQMIFAHAKHYENRRKEDIYLRLFHQFWTGLTNIKNSNLRKITFSDFLCQYLDWFILIFDSNLSNFEEEKFKKSHNSWHHLIDIWHSFGIFSRFKNTFDSICQKQSLEDTNIQVKDYLDNKSRLNCPPSTTSTNILNTKTGIKYFYCTQ